MRHRYTRVDTVLARLRKRKPVWLLLPAGYVERLPIGLVADLAEAGHIEKPTAEDLKGQDDESA